MWSLAGLEEESQLVLDSAIRLVLQSAVVAIFVLIIALIVKLLKKSGFDRAESARASETNRLLPQKEEVDFFKHYGTYTTEDRHQHLEAGVSTSSNDDLYDGNICVICYDDERNCFFTPCGHCVTCHTCATRIMQEEIKSCPICRQLIGHVRRLYSC